MQPGANAKLYFDIFMVCLRPLTKALYDVGEMPYRLAKPFLQQCRPDQLRAIEAASPVRARPTYQQQLLEDTEGTSYCPSNVRIMASSLCPRLF